jgi:hypothetical protein
MDGKICSDAWGAVMEEGSSRQCRWRKKQVESMLQVFVFGVSVV